MTWISTRISGVLHCSGTPSWWDVMHTAYWRRNWKRAFSVSYTIILSSHIHSYTCIYVHIRAHTCFSHLVVFCPLHQHIRAYTCIYLHILAYTGIYWHIRAGGGGDSEGGMHWHPLPVAFESESVTVLSWVFQTLRVRLAVAACGCGLADSESADLKLEAAWASLCLGRGSSTSSRVTWTWKSRAVDYHHASESGRGGIPGRRVWGDWASGDSNSTVAQSDQGRTAACSRQGPATQ